MAVVAAVVGLLMQRVQRLSPACQQTGACQQPQVPQESLFCCGSCSSGALWPHCARWAPLASSCECAHTMYGLALHRGFRLANHTMAAARRAHPLFARSCSIARRSSISLACGMATDEDLEATCTQNWTKPAVVTHLHLCSLSCKVQGLHRKPAANRTPA